jgi:hypothetical protein
MYKYFKVDSIQQGDDLGRELWQLCYPEGVTVGTERLFDCIEDGIFKIQVPDMVIPVFFKANFEDILNQLAATLNGYLTQSEGTRIGTLLRTGSANVLDLVPNGLEEVEPPTPKKPF